MIQLHFLLNFRNSLYLCLFTQISGYNTFQKSSFGSYYISDKTKYTFQSKTFGQGILREKYLEQKWWVLKMRGAKSKPLQFCPKSLRHFELMHYKLLFIWALPSLMKIRQKKSFYLFYFSWFQLMSEFLFCNIFFYKPLTVFLGMHYHNIIQLVFT